MQPMTTTNLRVLQADTKARRGAAATISVMDEGSGRVGREHMNGDDQSRKRARRKMARQSRRVNR
jgi:hypothetical protein